MSNMFIATNNFTGEQRNSITAWLKTKPWGFWHHFEDVWILNGVPSTLTPKQVYEEIAGLPGLSESQLLVMELPVHPGYWGRAPKPGWEWMTKYLG